MKTIEVVTYQFSELSPEAKKVAIEHERNLIMQNNDALYWFEEYCEDIAREAGFSDIKVQYSLSYCQGDGLSFSAKELNMDQLIRETFGECKTSIKNILKNYTEYSITGNTGHYCFASKSDVDLTLTAWSKEYNNLEKLVTQLREHIENKYTQVCKELEKTGYLWLEDSLKDETISENLMEYSDDTQYTANGKVFRY